MQKSLRITRHLTTVLIGAALLASCTDTPVQPHATPGGAEAARFDGRCVVEDDAARRVRTISSRCLNSEVGVPEGWTIRVVGATAAPSAEVIATAVTAIENPDAAYRAATLRIDVSGTPNLTDLTMVTDGRQTVGFDTPLRKRNVPDFWRSWSVPPFVEDRAPHVLASEGATSVTMTLSEPVGIFGFELAPNPHETLTYTAEFYAGAELMGSVTRQITGGDGARLFAAQTEDALFDRVVVSGDADFAIAQIRYATEDGGYPHEVPVADVYSAGPRQPSGVIDLADEWVVVEILDVEEYLGRPASARDVWIGVDWAGGTAAEAFELLDIDSDGRRDIRVRFALADLTDDGHLSVETRELHVWGRDASTGELYHGTITIDVVGDHGFVIDQGQLSAPAWIASFSDGGLAQSFQTQQDSHSTAGAGLFLHPMIGGGAAPVHISLWTDLPNAGGTRLAEGEAIGARGEWVDVFWEPVELAPNTTYYLVFESNSSLGLAGGIADPYPHGMVHAGADYRAFPQFDYTFRTWVEAPGGMSLEQVGGMRTSFPSGSGSVSAARCPAIAPNCG